MATTHAVLNVPSISCNHCKMAIEGAVQALSGVDTVSVDVHGDGPHPGQGADGAFDGHLAVIAGDARDVEHSVGLAHLDSSPSAGLPSSASLYVTE